MSVQLFGVKRYFKMQRLTFAGLGIDPLAKEPIKSPVLTVVPFLAMASLCVLIAQYTIQQSSNLDLVTDALSPFCQALLALWKLVMFVRNRKDMLNLVDRIWSLNLKANKAELEIIAVENTKDFYFCFFYYIFGSFTAAMAIVAPIMMCFWFYFKDGVLVLEPPLKAAYFFDTTQYFSYIMVVIWNSLGVYCIVFSSVGIDSLFSWCSHNILAQFRLLQLRLKQLGAAHEDGNPIVMQHIVECIQRHQETIVLAQEMNRVFGSIVFFKFTISCSQICFLAYLITRVDDDVVNGIFHGCFVFTVCVQLYLYCYVGQRLKDESELVAEHFYASVPWYDLSLRLQRILLVPMMRSRVVCDVTGIFFSVDLNLYLWVFRTAGSYITMLWTLADKE